MLFDLLRSKRIPETTVQPSGTGGVYVALKGGLGNQLFQYAFAHFLRVNGIEVSALALNYFAADRYGRTPLIEALTDIPLRKIPADELKLMRVVKNENGHSIKDTLVARNDADVVCDGYWQSGDYIDAAAQKVSDDLLAHGRTKYGADKVERSACVLHVRRTDYGHHGLLPLAYYLTCLEECGWPEFRVSTDEPNFSEHCFRKVQGYAGVMQSDARDPWGDFYAMANSTVQIIANSSFSWWTAWLGRISGVSSRIFAPQEWSLISDLQPCRQEWTIVDVKLVRP